MDEGHPRVRTTLHGFDDAVARRLRQWRHDDFAGRLLAHDPSLWSVHEPEELTDRLGWLDLPLRSDSEIEDIRSFAAAAHADGLTHTALLGMGGSSLAPETLAAVLPTPEGFGFEVIDSTHPAVVSEATARLDPTSTLFVVASKSGRTQETLSLYRWFGEWLTAAGRDSAAQFVAITDPGSPLAVEADREGLRRVWTADPEVGGRYSALTEFGLVPASLAGVDVRPVVEASRRARELLEGSMEERIELLRLGAILGELAVGGADKLTLLTGRGLAAFPAWLEQLVAESLGKRGRGVVPVNGEPLSGARAYGSDRLFVSLEIEDERNPALAGAIEELEVLHPVVRISLPASCDLGFEFVRWEVAAAAAATILGVHPFNQPDVEAAKVLAREALAHGRSTVSSQDGLWQVDMANEDSEGGDLERALEMWLRGVGAGGYVGIHAYLPPSQEVVDAARDLRGELGQLTRLATTFGYGPRFLHSTGQLHKGGPNRGLFIQLVDDPQPKLPIPESDSDFGSLLRAQAIGDAEALFDRGQWVLRLRVGDQPEKAIERLTRLLAQRRRGETTTSARDTH